MKFKIKQKIFEIKKLTYKNIDKKYIVSLNNRNIKYKKKTIKQQIKYIQCIRKKGDEIFAKGPVGKFFSKDSLEEIMARTEAKIGDSIFLACGKVEEVEKITVL